MDISSKLATETRSTPRAALVVGTLFVALVGIGVMDSLTGSDLSFGAFYVLVVVAMTVRAGIRFGIAASVFSALMWGVADVITSRSEVSLGVYVWNGLARLGVHATVAGLVAALVRALRTARRSEARSRAFLAAAAHQLRTPVAALSTSVEALLFEDSTPNQERLLANVAGEASRLGRLVSALLRTARLDQGEPLQPGPVDLRLLCEEEVDRARQLSSLKWELTVEAGIPDFVLLDAAATREALGNLFDNAMRHATHQVTIAVRRKEHHRLVIAVSDDGPGLPAGAETLAFDRFVTLDGRGGTGLGLSIARELSQQQGGDLTYASKAFVISLPLAIPPPALPRPGPPAEPGRW